MLLKLSLHSLSLSLSFFSPFFPLSAVYVGVWPALCFVLGRGALPPEHPNDGHRFGTSQKSTCSRIKTRKKRRKGKEKDEKKTRYAQERGFTRSSEEIKDEASFLKEKKKKKEQGQVLETNLGGCEVIGQGCWGSIDFSVCRVGGVMHRQLPTPKREAPCSRVALHGKL